MQILTKYLDELSSSVKVVVIPLQLKEYDSILSTTGRMVTSMRLVVEEKVKLNILSESCAGPAKRYTPFIIC